MRAPFDGIWSYGRSFIVFDRNTTESREFRGFLEHSVLAEAPAARSKAGLVSKQRYRLISEPAEGFPDGVGTKILCGGMVFELLNTAEIYVGDELSHRECILRRIEGGA